MIRAFTTPTEALPDAAHRTRASRSFVLAAACAALAACHDTPTGPALEVEPAFLIGSSPLALADPRPSPWGDLDGLQIDVDVSSPVFGEEVERHAFRTSARLVLGDGSVALVDPKDDPAANVDPKHDPAALVDPKGDPVTIRLVLPFPDDLRRRLKGEKSAVRTDVVVELLRDGAVVDRASKTAWLTY